MPLLVDVMLLEIAQPPMFYLDSPVYRWIGYHVMLLQ